MNLILKLLFMSSLIGFVPRIAAHTSGEEFDSMPSSQSFQKCSVTDLIYLSKCCDDVLQQIDKCEEDDLLCECQSIQSVNSNCYDLCPGSPSANFFKVIIDECTAMSQFLSSSDKEYQPSNVELSTAHSSTVEISTIQYYSAHPSLIQSPERTAIPTLTRSRKSKDRNRLKSNIKNGLVNPENLKSSTLVESDQFRNFSQFVHPNGTTFNPSMLTSFVFQIFSYLTNTYLGAAENLVSTSNSNKISSVSKRYIWSLASISFLALSYY